MVRRTIKVCRGVCDCTLPTPPFPERGFTLEFRWDLVWSSLPVLLQGAKLTVQLTSVSVFFGIIIGTITGIARISKGPLRYAAAVYIDVIRGGTPCWCRHLLSFTDCPG